MDIEAQVYIMSVDRLIDGLMLYFSDGSCGLYSDRLLYSSLALAVRWETDETWGSNRKESKLTGHYDPLNL
jgi:hypothetical protein